jgi:tetratricopeptide (TPR) repeat protein
MTIIAALVLSLCLADAQTPGARQDAERLAASGNHAEALKRFQAIAAANPDDLEARLWIARLHLRMGHARRAAGVYESIVAVDPKNVEALAGLGSALVEAGDFEAAAGVLDTAEALAPDRLDILAAQGHRHGALGRSTLALAYYGRALAAEPDNAAIQAAADALRAARAHRVALGYTFQRLDPAIGDFNAGSLAFNARVSDRVRLLASGEILRVDDSDEARGGGGIEWRAHPRLLVRAGGLFGGETWLPAVDTYGEAIYSRRRAHWMFTLRFFDFDGADLWIGGPGLAYDVTPRVTLLAQYLRGRTQPDAASSLTSDNFLFGLHGRPTDRVAARVEYRRGIDRLDWLTFDRLFADEAHTLGAGGTVAFTPFVSVGADYDYQDRSASQRVHRARGLLNIRF